MFMKLCFVLKLAVQRLKLQLRSIDWLIVTASK